MDNNKILSIDDDIENIVRNLPDKYNIIINLKNYNEIIKKINELTEIERKNLFFILNYYYNVEGESLIDDKIFDQLMEMFPQYDIDIFDNKTILPYDMPSLKKAYPDHKQTFMNYISKFIDYNINISSKLDGVSCLLVKNKDIIDIYTKGKSNVGRKINHILKYINIGTINYNKKIVLRGELIIKKENSQYFPAKSALRSQVVGLINKKNINKNLLKYIDLVFYEVKIPILSKNNQLNLLNQLNLKVVKNINLNLTKETNIQNHLTELYKDFIKEEKYDIDGLVICDLNTVIKNNENYIFAFKFNTIFGISKVVNIQWSITKNYIYIPKIIIEPIILDKIRVSKISGFNASYVLENKIGIGAEIKIKYSGNVIPTLDSVIKPSDNIPYPADCSWDDSQTHLISNNTNILESLSKQIEKFYIIFKIKSFAYKTILKVLLYLSEKHKITNIFDYINILKEYEDKNIKILGDIKDKLLYQSLHIFETSFISITSLLTATNKFKLMDERKILNILKNSSKSLDIITKKIPFDCLTVDDLKSINEVSDITAKNFINGLRYFMENITLFERHFNINYTIIFKDKLIKVVFTNLKSKEKQYLDQYQDYFTEYINVSKIIDYVVTNNTTVDDDKLTDKQKKAIKYNIPIVSIKEFINIIKNIKK